jgi:hypothetical protein
MAKARLRLVTPTTVNRTVTPKPPPNKDVRTREQLTETEVERLIKATQGQPLWPPGWSAMAKLLLGKRPRTRRLQARHFEFS